MTVMIGIEIPPERDWPTLKQDDAEIGDAEYSTGIHDGLDDEDMDFVVCDAEEEESNRNLQR
jgi:hypothetical protein